VVIAPPEQADAALAAMRAHPLGACSAIIGRIDHGEPGRVTMRTVFGGRRIVDMLVGEQLPRIC
ncbi:MAG TPA: hydrogenase expression/formation protein HypE, partial [Bradyrhizobium sp.]|nr:hydrogenase expression/formation protein HypE [Bradyrhizobium sp.]